MIIGNPLNPYENHVVIHVLNFPALNTLSAVSANQKQGRFRLELNVSRACLAAAVSPRLYIALLLPDFWQIKKKFVELALKFPCEASFEKDELPLLLSPSFLRQHGQCSEEV